MDRYATIAGAFDAGKLPSHKQIEAAINALLQSGLLQVEPRNDEGTLSQNGKIVATDIRRVLEAYKTLGNNKNGDDVIQDALWNIRQSELDINTQADGQMDISEATDQAKNDAQQLSSAFHTLVKAFVGHVSFEGKSLFTDLASFFRLFLADQAEVIEEQARATKDTLRETEDEVQKGERDVLGRPLDPDRRLDTGDTQQKFEKRMDFAKDVGSQAIGTAQSASQTVQEQGQRARNQLNDALNNMVKRVQDDPEYQQAISEIFGLLRKWYNKLLESADTVTLDAFVNDPSGRTPKALRQVRALIERLAGGKSLDDILNAYYACVEDIKNDDELRNFTNEYLDFVQHNLDDQDYLHSEESKQRSEELFNKWKQISGAEAESRPKWRSDIDELFAQVQRFQTSIRNDKDVKRLEDAHIQLGKDIAQGTADVMSAGLGSASWLWTDLFNVYLPRMFEQLKSLPIPRTEFVDSETEFVIENLDVSSVKLLPGRAKITTLADLDISQEASNKEAQTNVQGHTRIRLQGVQLALKEVSFYYHDKTGSAGPDTFTGMLDITLPEKGVDVDLALAMIPVNDSMKSKEQRAQSGFFDVKYVHIDLSDQMELSVRKTNHPILASVFKPMVRSRFSSTLERALREQIQFALEMTNAVAWDVNRRAGVFRDAGMSDGASYAAGIWSEIGHMRGQPGPLSGWKMTGTGVVKDDERTDVKFAMGAEPQVLSGEKHGPMGTFKEPLAEKAQQATNGKNGKDVGATAGDAQAQVQELAKKGADQTQTFKNEAKARAEKEKKQSGWRSVAFDELAHLV